MCVCVLVSLLCYLWAGLRATALGWSKSIQNRTFLDVPSRLATSIRLVSESVQYNFLPSQSQASPSGLSSPDTTTVWPVPSASLRAATTKHTQCETCSFQSHSRCCFTKPENKHRESVETYSWRTDSSGFAWWPPRWHLSKIWGPQRTGSPLLLHPPVHWQQWPTHPAHPLHLPIVRHAGWQKGGEVCLERRREKVQNVKNSTGSKMMDARRVHHLL